MNSSDRTINSLLEVIKTSHEHKSSYWKPFLQNFKYSDKEGLSGISGFGNRSRTGTFRNIYHKIGLHVMRLRSQQSLNVATAEKLVQETCTSQSRAYDYDAWRHANTFAFITQKLPQAGQEIKSGCVIGDGQSNFAGNFFKFFRSAKVLVDVNLPEVLLSEYLLMKTSLNKDIEIEFLSQDTDFQKLGTRQHQTILLCTPDNFSLTSQLPIDLFANISSMQEMKQSSIDAYFNIMRANKGSRHFYCANRKSKTLEGGEHLEFKNFGWRPDDVILAPPSPVPWHQEYYHVRPPFICKFDGEHLHTLVRFTS